MKCEKGKMAAKRSDKPTASGKASIKNAYANAKSHQMMPAKRHDDKKGK